MCKHIFFQFSKTDQVEQPATAVAFNKSDALVNNDDIVNSSIDDPNKNDDIATNCSNRAIQDIKANLSKEDKNGNIVWRKISLSGRTKEGLDDDRFKKRSNGEAGKRKLNFSCQRRIVIRKKTQRYRSKENQRRSLRKKVFKMIMSQEQEESKAEQNSIEISLKREVESCKPVSPPRKPEKSNSKNETKFKFTFRRKTGDKQEKRM